MASSPDFTILNAARISYAGFSRILGAARSPATNEAAACYQAALSYGVDPAVMLGVFRKESTYGRTGVAATTRSWGNIRASDGHFKSYPTWADGARDCARLLAVYGANRIRPGTKTSTVQTFPYVWAPSSDGNSPDAYGDSIVSWIIQWQTAYPGPGAGGGASSGDTGSGSAPGGSGTTVSASLLLEFLATISRRESDPVRQQDVIPFIRFLQAHQLAPLGDPNNSPGVTAILNVMNALIGRPWSEVAAAFSAAAAAPNDPFGVGAAVNSLLEGLGAGVAHLAAATVLLVFVVVGAYLVVTSE